MKELQRSYKRKHKLFIEELLNYKRIAEELYRF